MVLLVEAETDDMEKIHALAGLTGSESPGEANNATLKLGVQLSIRQVDGVKYTFDQVRADWRQLFPKMRDTEALKYAWIQINGFGEQGKTRPVPVTIG
jgi:hypothetical protein